MAGSGCSRVDVAIIGATFLASLALVQWAVSPERSGEIDQAVVFAPWVSASTAIRRVVEAGAWPMKIGPVPFVVIVRAPDAGTPSRLRRLGALLIFDAAGAGTCSVQRKTS